MRVFAGVVVLMMSASAYAGETCSALTSKLTAAPREEMVTQKLADRAVTVCKADPSNKKAEPYRLAALFYLEHGQIAKAVKLFDDGLKVEPKCDLARAEKALALVRMEKFDAAAAEGKKVVASKDSEAKLDANNAVGLAIFQKYYESQGDAWAAAEPYFRTVLEMKPDDAKTCYFIGILERYGKRDKASGMAYLRKACDGGYEQACGEVLQ